MEKKSGQQGVASYIPGQKSRFWKWGANL